MAAEVAANGGHEDLPSKRLKELLVGRIKAAGGEPDTANPEGESS
jgi:hypothetical protein